MTARLDVAAPQVRPQNPRFSSGPCAKRPGWELAALNGASLGRSHRAAEGKAKLQQAIDLTRTVLQVPDNYRIGIVPASDTGAFEMAMWSLLGARPVTMLAWESFGSGWVSDVVNQLQLKDVTSLSAEYGQLPDLDKVDFASDVCFTWNGTTSGVRVPDGDFISTDRQGLTLCDATSAAFAQDLPFDKLDVTTFSWQKVLGGEGGHGVIILSPRAVERLENYTPSWPLPKIFRLTKDGKLIEGIFSGATINTPSMLCVEDYIDALNWGRSLGGLEALRALADTNFAVLANWVSQTPWVEFLAEAPQTRSNTSVCLKIVDSDIATQDDAAQNAFVKRFTKLLDDEAVAFDIGGYRDAPPGLRIWTGATVEASDLEALTPWLDWAFATAKSA